MQASLGTILGNLTEKWDRKYAIRTDFERRQMLIELDVLVAMALGMTCSQLKQMYVTQFAVLKQYEQDTYYDPNGRIVYSSKNMGNYGVTSKDWGHKKNACMSVQFEDDTLPGGIMNRIINYEPPYDLPNREKDYEEVWENFEKRFSGGEEA